ncbi:MAG: hypothetical protein J6V88_03450 [Kiritimatiellae bacterium]|nr:hypothetical protein [Kiritimatiellia bacterium]
MFKPSSTSVFAFITVTTLTLAASHWNGGRVPPVHRLAPVDGDSTAISPSEISPSGISFEKTCGQCHDVSAMNGASHFRTGLYTNEAVNKAYTEPWFLVDEKLGTSIPLSFSAQKGIYTPAAIGMSAWQWTKEFARNFPGGGIGSDTNAMEEVCGAKSRWLVTGPLEKNCLACHQQDDEYDSSEWARQIARENFSGAASAASGIAQVEGMNARMGATWSGAVQKVNPDDKLFKVPQRIKYDLKRFDDKNRCLFKVGKPRNERCFACHSVTQKDMPSHAIAGDVHLRAGMKCVDCHYNGIDHRVQTKSCGDCHIDPKGAGPKPAHKGIPLVHFKKISCRVCHSGVTANGEVAQVRTSRANRIGIYGRAQWATDIPNILEPIYMKTSPGGKISPYRMTWPSFFAVVKGENVEPIRPDDALLNGANAIKGALTKSSVAKTLNNLSQKDKSKEFAFIGHGKLWKVDGTNLVASAHSAAEPIYWGFTHDIRPRRQARGAAPAKCADCHTGDSKFFLGKITPTGPITDAHSEAISNYTLMGLDGCYQKLLGTTFAMRPLFKVFLWAVFGFMAVFAIAMSFVLLKLLIERIAEKDCSLRKLVRVLTRITFILSLLYLASSGIIGWISGTMTSYALILHMVAGGIFAACVPVLAMFSTNPNEECICKAGNWSIWCILAAVVLFSAVMPMMTVFGGVDQLALLWLHRISSLAFVFASIMVCVSKKVRCYCKMRKEKQGK